jgi:hypothetical protein
LHRELGGIDATLSDLRHASGDRVEATDVHRLRRPRDERDRRERAGRKRAAAGLDEEIPAALALK